MSAGLKRKKRRKLFYSDGVSCVRCLFRESPKSNNSDQNIYYMAYITHLQPKSSFEKRYNINLMQVQNNMHCISSTYLFMWTPLISGLGLGPRCSLNVIKRCFPPPNASDASDETENNDRSVVTLSCDGERSIRHDRGVAGAVDVLCLLLILCIIGSLCSEKKEKRKTRTQITVYCWPFGAPIVDIAYIRLYNLWETRGIYLLSVRKGWPTDINQIFVEKKKT